MERPRIKEFHQPARVLGGRIRLGTYQFGVAYEIDDDPDGIVWSILSLMDGSRTGAEIVQAIALAHPQLDAASVPAVIDLLVENGSVEDAAAPVPAELSERELERYGRNFGYFSWADTKPRDSRYHHQLRLKSSTVCVVGVGGSGSSVALSLAAMGVGSLQIVDFDRVELSNTNRQFLYDERDIGRPKVEVAVERLRALNSSIDVSGRELHIAGKEDLVALMAHCDLLILCADSPQEIRYWANQAALETRTAWMLSAYGGPMTVVGMFVPFETPCLRCFEVHAEEHKIVTELLWAEKPSVNAVLAPVAALAGHTAALDAAYFLTGMKANSYGAMYHHNLLDFEHVHVVRPERQPGCPACGPSGLVASPDGG